MADRDALAVFDDDVIASVATDHGMPAERLAAIVREHQASVRSHPGVDNLVYEWRNHFHLDPLLARVDEAYYLALADHVWEEFAEHGDLTDTAREALISVHDRQARRDAEEVGFDRERLDDEAAVVLVRR